MSTITENTLTTTETVASQTTQTFIPPKDWPKSGPIDLTIHDLPHDSSTTEWWYVNSHIETEDGKEYSLFSSFFRKFMSYNEETKEVKHAHSITWGIASFANENYQIVSIIDQEAPRIGLEEIKKGKILKDPLLRRAAIELLEQNKVPRPDRLFEHPVQVSRDRLYLNFDGNEYEKIADGKYQLKLHDVEQNIGCDITITLLKPPIRHGDNGVVRGVSAEDMFYYFIPSCRMEGTITVDGETKKIKKGKAWYDHEFGCHQSAEDAEIMGTDNVSWNWISVQLNNGYEMTAYDLVSDKTGENVGHWLIVIDPEGNQKSYKDFTFTPLNSWTSMRTFHEYPTKWTFEIPPLDIHFDVQAAFDAQEFRTVISKPAFWEGRVNIKGTMLGESVEGVGFIERHGFVGFEGMHDFFKAVGRKTRESVRKVIPFDPTPEEAARLVSSKDDMHFLKGIDLEQYSRTIIQPIREIIDRGGKAWRSYLPLACCDIVGGNSQMAQPWLALPEFLHVGSLIVDDVEDKSDNRRGGLACHKIYGEATAINAGTACYFIGQDFIYNAEDVSSENKLRIYNLYFQAMRASHSGQAIDIDGFAYIMPKIVESGDGESLEEQVMAIHLLKAAVPASFLGRMGVILGKGNKAQEKAISDYLEAVGLAFQIIDDVLNLRGFKNNLKDRGEDLMHGKVTLPVAKAMSKLSLEKRQEVWNIVSSKTHDLEIIDQAILLIEECGAMDECVQQATDLVESSWQVLSPLVEDSYSKLMLRAFGWFVLDRDY